MTQPLALVVYEKLLPGSQLVNRLQDLNYRTQTVSDPSQLLASAVQSKPMLVFVDLEVRGKDVLGTITQLKQNPATGHIPVIGFSGQGAPELEAAARTAGVNVLATEAALLNHLPLLLEQALQVE
jgi:CheY-like chemotaxis protein